MTIVTPPGSSRTDRSEHPVKVGVAIAMVAVVTLGGCASIAGVEPEVTTFAFEGMTLDVRSHGTATDLVAADRGDVKVTRWFDAKGATGVELGWGLEGEVLDLQADCTGFANCDARFRVEVPHGVLVLRDGKPTDLRGAAGTGEGGAS